MRLHFSSEKECYLRLGGVLMGSCGKVEKFIDLAPESELLVEFLPVDGNLLPLTFVITAKFFENPPTCLKVYQYGIGADIVACQFQPRNADLQVIEQLRVQKLLATCIQQQTVQLLLESDNGSFHKFALPNATNYALEQIELHKQALLLLKCTEERHKKLFIFDQNGKLLLEQLYTDYSLDESLKIVLQHNTLPRHCLQAEYTLEGERFIEKHRTLVADKNFDIQKLHTKLLPFAFFQSVLVGADCTSYLNSTLQAQTELLKGYLGEFIDVQIPKDIFYHHYGEVNAVGLVYKQTETLHTVKFFTVDLENGKICNLHALDDYNT